MIPFYAEELGNINVLRACVSTDASCDVAKSLQVKNNVLTIDNTVVADLSSVDIAVSTQNLVVAQPNDAPATEDGLISWEIKLSLLKTPKLLRSQQTDVKEWWTSKMLLAQSQQKEMVCQHCAASLIDSSVNYKIKDLPSEHWYELVECWICHETKPEEHQARMRPILARPDTLLVGTTYFLIHPDNLIRDNIKVDSVVASRLNWDRGTLTKWIAINCSQCDNAIGEGQYCIENEEMMLLAVKLFKYCLLIQPSLPEVPTFTDFLVSDLVNTAKIHATHRFLIQGRQSERIYALIWLFNWDTNIIYNNGYANKENCALTRERVMKVIYLDCTNQNDEHTKKYVGLWSNDKSTDHLIYPDNACHQLVTTLNQSTLVLPCFMRKINHPAMVLTQNFSIGFINRSD